MHNYRSNETAQANDKLQRGMGENSAGKTERDATPPRLCQRFSDT